MSDLGPLLGDSLAKLLEQRCPTELVQAWERGEDTAALWTAVEEMGLPLLLVAETAGGAGGDLADAVLVLRLAGRHFAPLPLAETLLANRLLTTAGMEPPAGPLALALAEQPLVHWGARASHLLLVEGERLSLLPGDAAEAAEANLAGEPRGRLRQDLPPARAAGRAPEAPVFELLALLRAAQSVGAMERVLDMAGAYVAERTQFGRPLNRFQAIQHHLVAAAGETAAARIAVAAAADAACLGDAGFEIAAAKARSSEAAGKVAAIVHQLHGAIGFTRDLPLNLGTRRLWAWREDYGNETLWQERLGRLVAGLGGDGLWPALTRLT